MATEVKNSHSVKKGFNLGLLLKIAIPVVAVILVGAILFSVFSKPEAALNSFSYLRDAELFLSDYSAGSGNQLTEDFKKDNVLFSNYKDYIRVSNDGKRVFFVDNYDGTSYKLYYKNTNKLDSKPIKISSDIIIYDINDDGSVVTYTKDNGVLHQHNLTKQSKAIDKDVVNYLVSDNGKTIIYQKRCDGENSHLYDIYLSKSGKKGEKILSAVAGINYVSDDLSTIYYVSDDVLYQFNVGKTPKKITDNVREVIKVYESGEIYFTKANDKGVSLYFFNGKKVSKAIVENFYRTEAIATDKPVAIVFDNANTENPYTIIIKDKCYSLKYNVASINMNNAGTEIFFTADYNTDTALSTLYSAKIEDGIGKVKKVTDSVSYGKYLSGEKFVYMKDYNMSTMIGTAYCDKKEIGKNVSFNNMKYCKESDTIVYFSEVVDIVGKLNKFTNGKASKLRDSVLISSLSVSNDGQIIFIGDYYKNDGVLYTSNGSKTVQIDHDVSEAMLIISNEEYDARARSGF